MIVNVSNTTAGLGIFAIGVFTGWLLLGDTNRAPTYGQSGAPKNCRALIAANIDGWRSKVYTAEAVLNALDGYCGRNGSTWGY